MPTRIIQDHLCVLNSVTLITPAKSISLCNITYSPRTRAWASSGGHCAYHSPRLCAGLLTSQSHVLICKMGMPAPHAEGHCGNSSGNCRAQAPFPPHFLLPGSGPGFHLTCIYIRGRRESISQRTEARWPLPGASCHQSVP